MKIPRMKFLKIPVAAKIIGVLALVGGAYFLGAGRGDRAPSGEIAAPTSQPSHDHTADDEKTIWTCAMHPQIQLPDPGQCPICGMDLIPVSANAAPGSERQLTMTPEAKLLAEIETAPIERKFVEVEIDMVGKFDYDETRVKSISAWVPGRVDRLFVDYTGVRVEEGDHLVWLYSPDLLTAQEELIQADRWLREQGENQSETLRKSDLARLESSKEKLRQFGLEREQIQEVLDRGSAEDHTVIKSPTAGIVVHKAVKEGQYIKTGEHIYTVADLNNIWARLDAYESDLTWLHFGQRVELEAEAYPGAIFEGVISFIEPVMDAKTRTVKIRVNVDNAEQKLKPGMFAKATVHSQIARGGKVMDPLLAGKWIAPMHPEIVRDAPGHCPICGMELTRAEDLGYVSATDEASKPLVVPATAVLMTGKRAVVYVEVPDADQPTYEGREVVLGPRAKDYYLVEEGLAEGERVVVHGSFKIDSALQIQAKPSMMSMGKENEEEPFAVKAEEPPAVGNSEPPSRPTSRPSAENDGSHVHGSTGEEPPVDADPSRSDHEEHSSASDPGPGFGSPHAELNPVYDAYFALYRSMLSEDLAEIKKSFSLLDEAARDVVLTGATDQGRRIWNRASRQVRDATSGGSKSVSLRHAKRRFQAASIAVVDLDEAFGHVGGETYYLAECPRAKDGTWQVWLQRDAGIANPYLASENPSCGNFIHEHPARKES